MIAALARAVRWLSTGRSMPRRVALLCQLCANGYHVHSLNTGQCITRWCECGGEQ